MSKYQHQRKLINYLLQPFLQLRIGVYSVVLGLVFFLIISYYLFHKLNEFSDVIVTLTQSDEAIHELIQSYLSSTLWFALGLGCLFIVANFIMTIYYTHKMVGPTVAFRRQINALISKKYDSRLVLRKGDAFLEVADLLNKLSERLESDSQDQTDSKSS